MGLIPEAKLEEYRPRLLAWAESYTRMKKQGGNFMGKCPLPGHDDRTPSFAVFPDNHWKCFGKCGTGGDVYNLVQLIENIGFREAFERVSGTRLDDLPEPPSGGFTADDYEEKEVSLTDNRARWVANLWEKDRFKDVADWLLDRGIDEKWGRLHEIGYSDRDPSLPKHVWHKIMIPYVVDGQMVAIKYRYHPLAKREGENYFFVTGSYFRPYLYNQDCITPSSRWHVLIESELDAVAINAYLDRNLSIARAAGSFYGTHARWLIGKHLITLNDNDAAGYAQDERVKAHMRRAYNEHVPIEGESYLTGDVIRLKDPGDCFKHGVEIPALEKLKQALKGKPFIPDFAVRTSA